jgi:hypothetical protein
MTGELKYFFGFQVKQLQDGTFISQTKYTQDILKEFGMKDAKLIKTPMGTNVHLDLSIGCISIYQKVYWSMIGSLLYLCAFRPDIMLSVCMCARFQVDSKECHLRVVKRILRYIVLLLTLGFRILRVQTLIFLDIHMPIMLDVRLIRRVNQGLIGFCRDPWCLGLQRNKILLP